MARLSSSQANLEPRTAIRSDPSPAIRRLPFAGSRLRIWLYGIVAGLVLTTLVWSGQRTRGIAVVNADSLDTTAATFAAARTTSLENSPLSPIELLTIAAPLIDGGQRSLAIELLTEANRRDPAIRDVHLQLGYALMKEGKLSEAKAALERARTLDPLYPETFQLLAVVEQALGNSKEAELGRERAEQFSLVPKLPELTR